MRLFSAGHMLLLLASMALLSSSLAANQANSPTDTTQQIQWLDAPELPIALQEIYPAVFEERIVVGGGFTPSKTPSFFGLGPSDKVFILNPARARWQNAPDLPEPRHHLGMVSNHHYLYAIGGFTGNKENAWQVQRSVFRLDGNLQRWRKSASLPIPLAESIYANVSQNIHVIGGKTLSPDTGKHIDSTSHYVLVSNAYWRKAKPPTIARNSAASAVIGDRIYVIGGRTSGQYAKALSNVEVYDASTDSWSEVAPLPIAAAGLSASVVDDKIIVTGGEVFANNGDWRAGKALDSVWQYDPALDRWTALASLPNTLHGHGSVTLKGNLYILGGATNVGPQETTNKVITAAPVAQ